MTTTYTAANLAQIFPSTHADLIAAYVAPLNHAITTYSINTLGRAAMFIAQVGHESAGLTATVENLNYSQQSLLRVFPKYFPTEALAGAYARQPEKIAARVYANRMGNGTEASGDGWTYRGRGLIQITGHDNYAAFGKSINMALVDVPAYLATGDGAAMSAGWFWNTGNLNGLADAGRFVDVTKRINGGINGLDDRTALWQLALKALA